MPSTPAQRLRAAVEASWAGGRKPRKPPKPRPVKRDPPLPSARRFKVPSNTQRRRALEQEAGCLRRELATTTRHLDQVVAELAALSPA